MESDFLKHYYIVPPPVKVKRFAEKAGFDASSVGRGIRLGSSPSADTAVRIAKVLNVSVEYLVTGKANSNEISKSDSEKIHELHKYAKTLDSLEKIPERFRNPLLKAVDELAKEYEVDGSDEE